MVGQTGPHGNSANRQDSRPFHTFTPSGGLRHPIRRLVSPGQTARLTRSGGPPHPVRRPASPGQAARLTRSGGPPHPVRRPASPGQTARVTRSETTPHSGTAPDRPQRETRSFPGAITFPAPDSPGSPPFHRESAQIPPTIHPWIAWYFHASPQASPTSSSAATSRGPKRSPGPRERRNSSSAPVGQP